MEGSCIDEQFRALLRWRLQLYARCCKGRIPPAAGPVMTVNTTGTRLALSRRHALTSLLTGLMAPSALWAQGTFPTKPLRFVVPYPPGGIADSMARLLQPVLQAQLGQTVVIENKSGAGGNLGTDFVAKSPPDGY